MSSESLRPSVLPIQLLEATHVILLVLVVAYLAFTQATLNIPVGWHIFWSVSLLVLAVSPRFPWLGLLVFFMLAYLTPRYSEAMDVLLEKNILHWTCVFLLSGFILWRFRTENKTLINDPLTLLMLVFIGWLLITFAVASATYGILEPFPKHHPGQYLQGLLMFLVAAQFCNRKPVTIAFIGVACLALLIRMYLQDNTFLASDMPLMAVITLPLAILGTIITRNIAGKTFFAVSAVALLYTIGVSQNRASAVALAVLILVICWQYRRYWRSLAVILGILILCVSLLGPKSYWNRFQAIWDSNLTHNTASLDRGSVDQRLKLWKAGTQITLDNPIFGVGVGNFGHIIKSYAKLSSSRLPTHNNFINISAETGFPGLILYCALFVFGLLKLRRVIANTQTEWQKSTARMIAASLFAYLAAGLFISRQDMVFAYLLLGWALSLSVNDSDQQDLPSDYEN